MTHSTNIYSLILSAKIDAVDYISFDWQRVLKIKRDVKDADIDATSAADYSHFI